MNEPEIVVVEFPKTPVEPEPEPEINIYPPIPRPQFDHHGKWAYRPDHRFFFPSLKPSGACNCLHWTPEPRFGDVCPNCERAWVECEQYT